MKLTSNLTFRELHYESTVEAIGTQELGVPKVGQNMNQVVSGNGDLCVNWSCVEESVAQQNWNCSCRRSEHAGKISSILPNYPSKRPFRQNTFASFVPIFGRPPSGACISMKIENEMNLSKFWIKNVTRILPSENFFIRKFSCQNTLLSSAVKFRLVSFLLSF